MFCTNCGKMLPAGANACPNCGTLIAGKKPEINWPENDTPVQEAVTEETSAGAEIPAGEPAFSTESGRFSGQDTAANTNAGYGSVHQPDYGAGFNAQASAAPVVDTNGTNPLCIAGMIVSLSTIVLLLLSGTVPFFFFLALVAPIVGIILSAVGKKQAKERGEGGQGMAVAGIVIGAILLALMLITLVACIACIVNLSNTFGAYSGDFQDMLNELQTELEGIQGY